ncbi:MAG: TonB-dependent receptor [Thermodesulfobacteriota bacterium]|nr:TonB-dependent receptor [Thermodesulfobacteriota bacterium]
MAEAIKDIELGVSAGYRVDNVDWSIAGYSDGDYINIFSELTWKDLEIYQTNIKAEITVGSENPSHGAAYFKGCVGYGWIVEGENQDSDYDGNDRTLEWSRSNNDSDDGDTKDFSLGMGLRFFHVWDKLTLTPLVGYSYHEQNLTVTNGLQTISTRFPAIPLGPFPGLNSTYETQWKGPWVGVDLDYRLTRNFHFAVTLEYHWAEYEAEANWNLRTDLAHPKSFEHRADGNGMVISLYFEYAFTKRLSIDTILDFQDWKTETGVHRAFGADGSTGTTQLNEINWESTAFMLSITYEFF